MLEEEGGGGYMYYMLPYINYVLRYAPSQGVWFLSCFGLRIGVDLMILV